MRVKIVWRESNSHGQIYTSKWTIEYKDIDDLGRILDNYEDVGSDEVVIDDSEEPANFSAAGGFDCKILSIVDENESEAVINLIKSYYG